MKTKKRNQIIIKDNATVGQKISANMGKFDPQKAIELREKGLTMQEIGKVFGICKQSVSAGFKRMELPSDMELKEFQENRAGYLELHLLRLLQSVSPEDLKKMSGRDKFISSGVLYDKLRLEKGLSTQNQAVTVLTDAIRQASKN